MMHDAVLAILVGWAAGALAGPLAISRIETTVSPQNRGLRLVSGLHPGDSLNEEGLSEARARIASQLADDGYLSAEVGADTSVHGDSVVVSFRIQTGKPARIGGWRISADSGASAEKLVRLLPGRGTRFGKAVVDRAAASLLAACENDAYPFAIVTPRALVQDGGFVYPELQVEAGPRVQISYLEFAGNPVTKTGLLERVAGFSRGGYSPAATAHWRQSLEQSGLAVVDSQAIFSDERGYGVRFWVTGRRVNTASGVAGYSPTDRRLTGLAQVAFHNLFDSGRRLEAGWQSAYGRTSYRFGYTEPWVLGTPIDVTASAHQQTADTTSARTDLALAANARAAAWTTVSLETGYDRFTDVPSRTSADVVWAGTGVVVDSRDFPANPRSGVRLSAFTRVGNRATDSARSDVVTHVELGFNWILPLGRSLAWSNSVGLRAVYSAAALTTSELYTLGGPGTVRGYQEDEFSSSQVGWFSTELRYRLDRTSSVFPFLDVGVYQDSLGWQMEPGYGAGMRVATQVGVLGLGYGIAFRDSPLRGKVHLSYDVTF
jgi:outer membrane protein assembly factor BamA